MARSKFKSIVKSDENLSALSSSVNAEGESVLITVRFIRDFLGSVNGYKFNHKKNDVIKVNKNHYIYLNEFKAVENA